MSTEQSVQGETHTTHSQVDITQQATTPTPTTTSQRAKNPKRVAAGRLVAERTRLAREQQKKATAEAAIIIANNKVKAAAPPSNTVAVPEPTPPTESTVEKNISLSTTQGLAVASIVVSLIGIYYKREELKAVFSKKTPEPARVEPQPVRATQPSGVEPQPVRATQPRGVEPQPVRATQPRGVRRMD